MTFYGCVQEMATCVIYPKYRDARAAENDVCPKTI
jgi:acyl-[acyl-carrier-protein] desaturase